MARDEDFEPRLGRQRSPHGRSYLHRVLRASNLAGGNLGRRSGKVYGSRIGVGAGVGRVLAARDRFAAYRQRRVMVKFSYKNLGGKGLAAATDHLRYIQRDGVTRESERGALYSADQDRTDGKAFMARAEDEKDKRQFRFIVSAEDAAEYDDLKPFVRRLMARMEEDLGTKLDWVAADHYNTGHPHTHIVVRGRNDRGHDLLIAREYLTHGIRERAAELVSLDLGPRTDLEIESRLRREVEQERLTSIDRRLIRDMDASRVVSSSTRDPFQQAVRAGRLQKLGRLGLAQEIAPGRWQLAAGLDDTLRRMGERGDIIRTMQRTISDKGLARAAGDYAIYDPAGGQAITGRLVERGLSDELRDRHYLIIDGLDGRTHYVDAGRPEGMGSAPTGAILEIVPQRAEPRPVDRTVAQIAAAHGGRYSVDIHLQHDPSATATFAETHIRRLEAMRRARTGLDREPDGTWIIGPDHLDRAQAFEERRVEASPVAVRTLTTLPLEQQVGTVGATWLDRRLVSGAEVSRDSGFGGEVREAQTRRRQWLIAEGLAQETAGQITYRPDMLTVLRQRELTRVGRQLAQDAGLAYAEARNGQRIEGNYRRAVDLASGRFAVIETARELSLVPWRPVLERHIGKQVSGIMRDDAINWTIGRSRSGPSIT
jgi:type IV secretory pathway VirD2 relaxase